MSSSLAPENSGKVNWMRERPFAHRGLHDAQNGIFENSLPAIAAAMRRDYAIEVDLQPSADCVPMVFHDFELERMTGDSREIREVHSRDLAKLKITNTDDKIPTLRDMLDLVNGQVGLVLELKGRVNADQGFVAAVAEALQGYKGNVAIMSFHHHILEDARNVAPYLALGLTAYGGDKKYAVNKMIADKTDVDFVSYELETLDNRFLREFRANTGKPVISWTVKSEEEAEYSAKFADQPTFEGFLP